MIFTQGSLKKLLLQLGHLMQFLTRYHDKATFQFTSQGGRLRQLLHTNLNGMLEPVIIYSPT